MTATLTSPTFVGRTEELARLAAAGERAAGDVPTSVLIGGEAGVGKTRLVGEVVAAARAAGVTVLHGGCVELGGEGVPFAPLVEALRAFVRDLDEPALARMVPGRSRVELARLLPELGPPAGPGAGDRAAFGGDPGPWSEQGRLFELLLGLLERLGAERPALLVVEDLHWADRSTRDLLAFLVRNLRHGRLLLVMTYRSDELHRRHPLRPFLAELDRGRRVERLELARFGPAEVAAQLAGIRGAPPPAELAERIHARSGGNAFFVEELAATAATDGELSPSLRDTLLARIELLGEPTQQVLRVLAVAAAAVPDPLLAEVAGLGEAELLAGLREAVSAHVLLVDAGDGAYGFRHALVKEAVYAELLPGERTRLHARFAAALAGRDGGGEPGLAAELAWHWYAAHDLERALPAAVEAGVAAERAYAFAEAQRQFERALELWGGPARRASSPAAPSTRPSCWPGRARRPPTPGPPTGRWPWSAPPWPRSTRPPTRCWPPSSPSASPSTCGSPAGRGRSRPTRRRSAWSPGAVGGPGPGPGRPRAGADAPGPLHRGGLGLRGGDRGGQEVGAPVVEGHAMNSLGTAVARLGEIDRGLAYLEEARRRGPSWGGQGRGAGLRQPVRPARRPGPAGGVGGRGHRGDRGGHGGGPAADLRRLPGRQRRRLPVPPGPLGRDGRAHRRLPGAGRRREPQHGHPAPVPGGAGRRPGRLRGALAHVRAAKRLSGDMFIAVQYPPVLAAAEAEVAAWQGRLEDASAAVAEGLDALQGPLQDLRAYMLLAIGLRVEGDRAGLAAARHDHDTLADARLVAGGLLRWARTTLDEPEVAPRRALLATCEAEYSRVQGDLDPEGWLAAVAAWEVRPPLPAGHGPLAGGRGAAGQAGRPRPGRRPAPPGPRRGHDHGRRAAPPRAGAAGQAGRVELDRDRPGGDDTPEDDTPPAAAAVESLGLTARELEVLALVAEGRSNRQVADALFISAKTASVHVSNILAKLGVASRVEAAAVAHRLGLLDGRPGRRPGRRPRPTGPRRPPGRRRQVAVAATAAAPVVLAAAGQGQAEHEQQNGDGHGHLRECTHSASPPTGNPAGAGPIPTGGAVVPNVTGVR